MPAEGDHEVVASTAYRDIQQQRLLGSLQLRLSYMGLLSLIVSAMHGMHGRINGGLEGMHCMKCCNTLNAKT